MSLGVFQPWADLGYTSYLLPIARAGCRLSPYSNLTPDKLGKTPTVPTEDGWVGGVGWTTWDVSRETLGAWCATLGGARCNVGMNARVVHGLDVDTDDAEFARTIYDLARSLIAEAQLGIRVGRAPGFLVPFKLETPRHKARIVVVHTGTGIKSAVELLGIGQQYVVDGIHPKTRKPYEWFGTFGGNLSTTPLDRVRTVTDARFDALWSAIPLALEGTPWALVSSRVVKGYTNGQPAPSPEELLAPGLEPIREALRWLRNGPGDGRPRESWVAVGFAVAAATDRSPGGFAAFEEWSRQWGDAADHQANTSKLWASINPATAHIGWPWLAHQASMESGGRCTLAAELAFADHYENVDLPEDDGAFAEPQGDRPSLADAEAAVADLTAESSIEAVTAVIALIVKMRADPVTADMLLMRIKANAGVPLKSLRQHLTRETARAARDETDDAGRRIAQVTLATVGNDKLAWHHRQWHRYEAPIWRPINDMIVPNVALKVVEGDPLLLSRPGNPMPMRVHQGLFEAIEILKMMVGNRLAKVDQPETAMRTAVNCANCTLWINRNDGTVTTRHHDPDDAFLSYLDIDYDPTATCPRYDAVLEDMLSLTSHALFTGEPGHTEIMARATRAEATERNPVILEDGRRAWLAGRRALRVADIADNVRLVNEILGYILTPWRGARCFVIFKGNGSNGKSQLVQALADRMPGAVASKSIENFDQQFAYSEIIGKLLLWEDDLSKRVFISDGAAKKLTENKLLNAPVKFARDAQFTNTVVPVILSNNWPLTTDLSQGMLGRALVVPFNRIYAASERKANPWPAILADRREVSGMLNRWLAGLKRVLERAVILPSKAAEEAHARWVQRNMPEVAFLEELCMRKPPEGNKSDGESLDDLYNAYAGWYGHNIGNNRFMRGRNQFSEALEQAGVQSYASNGRLRFRGVWLHPDRVNRDFGVTYLGRPDDDGDDDDT